MIRFDIKKRCMPLLAMMLAGSMLLSSCGAGSGSVSEDGTLETDDSASDVISPAFDEVDTDDSWSEADAVFLTMSGDSVSVTGSGAEADGTTVTITMAGTYVLSGILNDGQVIVDTEETDAVRLVLNDADITCTTGAAIYVKSAEKTVLILADGTENSVTDGTEYVLEDEESDEPNAAIFCKSDLTINGNGTITVNANYNNGILSKDGLKIVSGTVLINAVGDGLRGRDYVALRDGDVEITAGEDGIKSNNDENPEAGFVLIEAGTVVITSGADAIQAETIVTVNGGDLTITAGGGSANAETQDATGFGGMPGNMGAAAPSGAAPGGRFSADTADSAATADQTAATDTAADTDDTLALPDPAPDASTDVAEETEGGKGIKAGALVAIAGGTFTIDASDDALHSGSELTISGGTLRLASGDDGIHSDGTITISGGEITITESYEGIEGTSVTISDGVIRITSDDDGINIAGGNDSSAAAGRFGADSFTTADSNSLQIDGGYLLIDAAGDGIDTNGSAYMTGGTVIVNGPTNSGNGAIDYNGEFQIIGGYLLAAGSSGMAQSPSADSSTQHTVTVTFDTVQAAGTMIALLDESGACVLAFTPSKQYQTGVISAPELTEGATYTVWYGGSATGWETDGMYTGATYTPGTEFETVTVSEMVTSVGASAGNMGGGAMGGAPGGGPGGGRSR